MSAGQLDSPAPLTWWRLLPLDMSLACAVIAVSSVMVLGHVPRLLDKLHLVEVLIQAPTMALQAMERIALTGSTQSPGAAKAPLASGRFMYGLDGTQLIASGKLRPEQAGFRLSLRPAIDEAGLGWHVLWLCGLRQVPAGWQTTAPALAENLPAETLPHMCRGPG